MYTIHTKEVKPFLQLSFSKRTVSLGIFLVGIVGVAVGSMLTADAATSQQQPSGTDFKWVSVSSATSVTSATRDVSHDGRYVLFHSTSPLLVEGDTNGQRDFFVKDMQTSVVERVSVDDDESQLTLIDNVAKMSPNGQYVAFMRQVGSYYQGYIRDRVAGTTKPVTADASGTLATTGGTVYSVTDSGKALFISNATNLGLSSSTKLYIKDSTTGSLSAVPFYDPIGGHTWNSFSEARLSNDGSVVAMMAFDQTTNFRTGGGAQILQVVAIDMVNNTGTLVTPGTVGSTAAQSYYFAIPESGVSRNGRYVLFMTSDGALLGSGTNASLYLKDLQTGSLQPVDNPVPGGAYGNGRALTDNSVKVSDDGRYIGYGSSATNLDPNFIKSKVLVNGYPVGNSLYLRDMQSSSSTMKLNQTMQGDAGFAPGVSKFVFTTTESIDNADSNGNDAYQIL